MIQVHNQPRSQAKIGAHLQDYANHIGIRIYAVDDDARQITHAATLVWQEVSEGEIIPGALALQKSAAQELMDQLWMCGIRPTAEVGTEKALSATRAHLTDMQTIAFGALRAKKAI